MSKNELCKTVTEVEEEEKELEVYLDAVDPEEACSCSSQVRTCLRFRRRVTAERRTSPFSRTNPAPTAATVNRKLLNAIASLPLFPHRWSELAASSTIAKASQAKQHKTLDCSNPDSLA